MYGIGGFFKKIQNSFSGEIILRNIIKDAVCKHCGIELSIDNVSYKNGVINLKHLNQSAKSAVFIKKVSILKELKEKVSGKTITDIRFS